MSQSIFHRQAAGAVLGAHSTYRSVVLCHSEHVCLKKTKAIVSGDIGDYLSWQMQLKGSVRFTCQYNLHIRWIHIWGNKSWTHNANIKAGMMRPLVVCLRSPTWHGSPTELWNSCRIPWHLLSHGCRYQRGWESFQNVSSTARMFNIVLHFGIHCQTLLAR